MFTEEGKEKVNLLMQQKKAAVYRKTAKAAEKWPLSTSCMKACRIVRTYLAHAEAHEGCRLGEDQEVYHDLRGHNVLQVVRPLLVPRVQPLGVRAVAAAAAPEGAHGALAGQQLGEVLRHCRPGRCAHVQL